MPPEYQVHESPSLEASVLGALVNTMAPLELPADEFELVELTLPTSISLLALALALLMVGQL